MKNTILLLTLFLLFSSCASTYKQLRPNSTYYPVTNNSTGIDFSYKHGILRESGNKKYAKREDKKAIRLAAVKITNKTGSAFTIGQNAKFYSGNGELILLTPDFLHRELKQGVPEYLLYLLLTPLNFYKTNSDGTVDSTPVGYVLGPGIAFGNMIGAGAANQNFLKELRTYDLINKQINPGETVYGIIGMRDNGFNPIELRILGN